MRMCPSLISSSVPVSPPALRRGESLQDGLLHPAGLHAGRLLRDALVPWGPQLHLRRGEYADLKQPLHGGPGQPDQGVPENQAAGKRELRRG